MSVRYTNFAADLSKQPTVLLPRSREPQLQIRLSVGCKSYKKHNYVSQIFFKRTKTLTFAEYRRIMLAASRKQQFAALDKQIRLTENRLHHVEEERQQLCRKQGGFSCHDKSNVL